MTTRPSNTRRLPDVPPFPIPAGDVVVEIKADPKRVGGRLVLQDGVESSYVDIAEPTHLEFEYLRHLARVLDTLHPKRGPMSMMQIGGGPCALARYLDATRKDLRAVVVERDQVVVDIAREWLGLQTSARLEVRVADGREALGLVPASSLDVLVVDAFSGVMVPHHLMTGEFTDLAREALRTDGLHVVNMIDIPPLEYAGAIVATLRERYAGVVALTDRETAARRSSGNVVIVASDRDLQVERLARFARLDREPWDLIAGRDLDALVHGAAPLSDDVPPGHALAMLGALWGRSREARTGGRA